MVGLDQDRLGGGLAVVDRHVGAVVDAADDGGGRGGHLTNLGREGALAKVGTLVRVSKVDAVADHIRVGALPPEQKSGKVTLVVVQPGKSIGRCDPGNGDQRLEK